MSRRRRRCDDTSRDEGDRFIKRVAAGAGEEVCADGRHLIIDGRVAAERHVDAEIPLGWSGCRVLRAHEVLLLGDSADSFDGRYWGVTDVALIEGVWRRL